MRWSVLYKDLTSKLGAYYADRPLLRFDSREDAERYARKNAKGREYVIAPTER